MAKINFNFVFVDLDGKAQPKVKIHELVARELAASSSANPQRNVELARKIREGKPLDLLSEDVARIREVIVNSPRITDLFKAQVLEAIEKATPKKR